MPSENNILEVEINRSIECSAEVAKWNYWDHEHLDIVHGGYKTVDVLYDDDNFAFGYSKIKVPVIPFFYTKSPLFLVQHDDNTQYTFAIQLGVLSKTTITINPISNSSCKITMNYKFYLDGWRTLLRPVLKKLIPIWNKKVWEEDYDLKIRRQKVLQMGFKDFWGLPDYEERTKDHKINELKLPVPRPRNSSRDRHPLSKNYFQN
jgi:hypothetical protein